MLKFLCCIVGFLYFSDNVSVEYGHYKLFMQPHCATGFQIQHHGTAGAWVEVYIDNYTCSSLQGYNNGSGNVSLEAFADDMYPSWGDLPHSYGLYQVIVYEWSDFTQPPTRAGCQCWCPTPCPN